MTEQLIAVNGVQLCTETFGDEHSPAILLVSGAAASMDWWDPEFCARLAAGGRKVIRYDLRDTGRSTSYPPGAPGYTGPDLVNDAAALIDTLGGGRAHVVGLSMGGGIAQHLAVIQPQRVATLTLMSTSPGGGPESDLPPPAEKIKTSFASPLPEPDWHDHAAVVHYLVESERPFAGPESFDETRMRKLARLVVERTSNVESSTKNHWLLEGGEDIRLRLGEVSAPTLVIHGADDQIVPIATTGRATARLVKGARLIEYADGPHGITDTHKDRLNQDLLDFISK
jgi:pimeloyl-ACP methyl ester carboxylesterase